MIVGVRDLVIFVIVDSFLAEFLSVRVSFLKVKSVIVVPVNILLIRTVIVVPVNICNHTTNYLWAVTNNVRLLLSIFWSKIYLRLLFWVRFLFFCGH